MQSRFYRDNFESYLRDQSDQFKMYPSKRTWHGIYNNFHPGRKWPSPASMLCMGFFLLMINNFNVPRINNRTEPIAARVQPDANLIALSTARPINFSLPAAQQTAQLSNKKSKPALIPPGYSNLNGASYVNDPASLMSAEDVNNEETGNEEKGSTATTPNAADGSKVNAKKATTGTASILITKAAKRKFSLSYFVSPTLNFRTVNGSNAPASGLSNASLSPQTEGDLSNAQGIMGFEVGSNINYNFSNNLQLITGVQLSYSGYDIVANTIHPRMATLQLNQEGDNREVNAMSYYGNDAGAESKITLHNYSWQASIPIGMQYKIAGNNKLSLSAAANVQPFYVISSNAYLLSSDGHSYISYPSLIRDFNVNTEVGTYLNFRASKLHWQVGPHFRYQLLSTYSSSSPYSEHLLNYGIRFGISK